MSFYDPPRFCSEDGLELIDIAVSHDLGFDEKTGEKRPDYIQPTKQCPTEGHDAWLLDMAWKAIFGGEHWRRGKATMFQEHMTNPNAPKVRQTA